MLDQKALKVHITAKTESHIRTTFALPHQCTPLQWLYLCVENRVNLKRYKTLLHQTVQLKLTDDY